MIRSGNCRSQVLNVPILNPAFLPPLLQNIDLCGILALTNQEIKEKVLIFCRNLLLHHYQHQVNFFPASVIHRVLGIFFSDKGKPIQNVCLAQGTRQLAQQVGHLSYTWLAEIQSPAGRVS